MRTLSKSTFWLTAGSSLVLSIVSSVLVETYIHRRIPLLGSFLGLQRSFNSGVAFGVDLGFLQPVLIGIALVAVCWIALTHAQTRISSAAYGLIVGGGLANVIDRLFDGKVTDVFQVGSFPIFNVADSAITVGVVLLLVDMIVERKLKS